MSTLDELLAKKDAEIKARNDSQQGVQAPQ